MFHRASWLAILKTHHLFKREIGPISDSIKNPDTDRLLGFIFHRQTLDPSINVYTHGQSHPPTPPPLCRRLPKYTVIATEKRPQYENAQKPTDKFDSSLTPNLAGHHSPKKIDRFRLRMYGGVI